jgi:hypothetical protein
LLSVIDSRAHRWTSATVGSIAAADRDHDGFSSSHEIATPGSEQIISFDLHAIRIHTVDERGNMRMLHSTFTRRLVGDRAKPINVTHSLDDIAFLPLAP